MLSIGLLKVDLPKVYQHSFVRPAESAEDSAAESAADSAAESAADSAADSARPVKEQPFYEKIGVAQEDFEAFAREVRR